MKYFGTDGIRGVGFKELNEKLAFKLGQGLKEALNCKKVVIGLDTRQSSNMLAYMLAAGALSVGVDVIFAGIASTPMIAYYSKLKKIAGVMITASHNPYEDNGIKVLNMGRKTNPQEELILESYIDNKDIKVNFEGKFELSNDIEEEYLKLIEKLEIKNSNIKISYDSANGANYLISNKIMSKFYENSIQIGNNPNGKNINLNCGSTNLNAIIKHVIDNKMDIGFAYDGDGDRVIAVDGFGKVYDGDLIIYIIAKYLKEKEKLTNNQVVLTKMSNPGILKALKKIGINYSLTDVGDKYVYQEMIDNNYILGGEASGHIILRNILDSGDGLLISLYLLKILNYYNLKIEELVKDVNFYPLKMVNIKNVNKQILKDKNVINYLEKIKQEFEEDDIFLIRASGTENLIRVTISSKDNEKLEKYMDIITKYLKEEGAKK